MLGQLQKLLMVYNLTMADLLDIEASYLQLLAMVALKIPKSACRV